MLSEPGCLHYANLGNIVRTSKEWDLLSIFIVVVALSVLVNVVLEVLCLGYLLLACLKAPGLGHCLLHCWSDVNVGVIPMLVFLLGVSLCLSGY